MATMFAYLLMGKKLMYYVYQKDARQYYLLIPLNHFVHIKISIKFRQTGSGKTYTMEGVENDNQHGIISRTISKIFEETNSLVEKVQYYQNSPS